MGDTTRSKIVPAGQRVINLLFLDHITGERFLNPDFRQMSTQENFPGRDFVTKIPARKKSHPKFLQQIPPKKKSRPRFLQEISAKILAKKMKSRPRSRVFYPRSRPPEKTSRLRKHEIAIHTKNFVHFCSLCKKGFVQASYMRKHETTCNGSLK